MPNPPLLLFAGELPAPLVWLVLAWLFAVGACVGSFMNVVIYRLPAGLSLLHPASRCPSCERPIRPTDNVPIFGWLRLRGRCRRCRAPISPRYPAVETLVASLFVVLAWAEPLSSRADLHAAATDKLTANELWGSYAYHLFLLCSLVCAAFTEFDGHRLTTRLILPPFVIGLIAPLFWPHLRPLTGSAPLAALVPPRFAGVVSVLAGLVLGLAIAALDQRRQTTLAKQQSGGPPSIFDFGVALAWVGAFLGWQAVVALGMLAGTTRLPVALGGRILPVLKRIGLIACLAPWTLAWILAWRAMVEERL